MKQSIKHHLLPLLCCLLTTGLALADTYPPTQSEVQQDTRPRLESRAAHSVDTATGAFVLDVNIASLQGGLIPLDFDLHSNSMIGRRFNRQIPESFSLGDDCWYHSFETYLAGDLAASNSDGEVVAHIGPNFLRFKRTSQTTWTLQNSQGKMERLELLTEEAGDMSGLWKLTRPDGTSNIYLPNGKIVAILDRNRMPIQFEDVGSQLSPYTNVRRIYTISKGLAVPGKANSTISSSFAMHKRPPGMKFEQYLDHLEQEGPQLGFGIYTHFAYEHLNDSGRTVLSKIYDPVRMGYNIAYHTPDLKVPKATSNHFQFTVTAGADTAPGKLLRITPNVISPRAGTEVFLISPAGTSLKMYRTRPGWMPASIMTDHFIGENLAGTWTLIVNDNYRPADSTDPIIKSIQIQRAAEDATWVNYTYIESNSEVKIKSSSDHLGNLIFRNYYSEEPTSYGSSNLDGRITAQETGRILDGQIASPRTTFEYIDVPDGDRTTRVYDRTPQKNCTEYVHDKYFNLKRVTNPLNQSTTYTYDPVTFFRTSMTNPLSETTSFTYDAHGRLSSMTEPGPGNPTTLFGHDEFNVASSNTFQPDDIRGYALTIMDGEFPEDLLQTSTSRVVIGRFPKDENKGKIARLRVFNPAGLIIFDRGVIELKPDAVTLLNSWLPSYGTQIQPQNPTQFYVNLAADAIFTEIPSGKLGNVTTIEDALGHKSTFKYDELSNLKSSRNALDPEPSYKITYDRFGKVSMIENTGSTTVEATNDSRGNATGVQIAGEAATSSEILYDTYGNVTKATNADGHSVEFGYDTKGNVVVTRNELGEEEIKVYNARNLLISSTDALGRTTTYEYDLNGNRTSVTNALGQTTRTEYDEEDRPIRQINALEHDVVTKYDAAGRIASVTDPVGNVKSYDYDAAGKTLATYRGGIKVASFTYNAQGLIATASNGHGHTIYKNYDALGQETSTTDAMGSTTTSQYDALGRLDSVTDPLTRTFTKTYLDGNLVDEIRDANNNATKFTYTNKNNVASITTPGNATTSFEYTPGDMIAKYIPPSLTKTQEYTYDEAGRLVKTHHPNSPTTPDILYYHDRVGNVTNIATQLNGGPIIMQISREYDALNRQTAIQDAAGNITRHYYCTCGAVNRIVYPGGKEVLYKYDRAQRLTKVIDWAGRETNLTYNAQDQITNVDFPNKTRRVFLYDHAALLSSRTDFDKNGNIIVRYNYTFDKNGKIKVEAPSHTTPAWTPTAMNMTYGANNQLATVNGAAITFDPDGNMTQGIVSGATTSLQWDSRNNLKQSGATVFNYDVQDRLIGWTDGANSVNLAVIPSSSGSMVMVSTPSTGLPTEYVYGIGLAYEVRGNEIMVHHYDERGNSIAVSGNDGTVTARTSYSPHGHIIQQVGTNNSIFKFGGLFGIIHAPGGLNYMRFRWYSPEMMRFLSLDSVYGDIDLPTTLNRYVYGSGDPINQVDITGEFPFLAAIVIAIIVGAAVSVASEAISNEIQGKPHRWENYLGAAIGGALGGVAGLACSVCAGVVESLASDLITAGLREEPVDGLELLMGAGTAFLGARLGKGIGKLGKKAWSKLGKGGKLITNKLSSVFKSGSGKALTALQKAEKKMFVDIAKSATKDLALAAPKAYFEDNVTEPLKNRILGRGPKGAASAENGNAFKYIIRATVSPAANVGKGGEYLHYERYLEALQLSGRPTPNPTIAIPSF